MRQWQINRISLPAAASIGICIRPVGIICAICPLTLAACSTSCLVLLRSSGISGEQLASGLEQPVAICCGCLSGTTFLTGCSGYYFTQTAITRRDWFRRDALPRRLSSAARRRATLWRRDSGDDCSADARGCSIAGSGIDMAIWGLILSAGGAGPLAGVLASTMAGYRGCFGRLYAEGHEAVERSPGRGLMAVGANGLPEAPFQHFHAIFPHFPRAEPAVSNRIEYPFSQVPGFVVAEDRGLIYAENMRLWNWDVVMFITLLLVAVVMAMVRCPPRYAALYWYSVVPLFKADCLDRCAAPPRKSDITTFLEAAIRRLPKLHESSRVRRLRHPRENHSRHVSTGH